MAQTDPIMHALLVTDAALRATFPSDFHKRCMYASFAIASLLEDAGLEAEVAGGDFLCAVVSTDGRQLSLQGFGTTGIGEPSHYWVHANGLLIDPGPAYLPHESPYRAPALPAIAWASPSPLPDVLAYRERVRVVPDATISDPAIAQRVADFVTRCRALRDARTAPGRLPFWLLRDMASLRLDHRGWASRYCPARHHGDARASVYRERDRPPPGGRCPGQPCRSPSGRCAGV
jgi:hypothetical protein